MTFDLIIIGSGLGGYTLAKNYRSLNKSSTILLISADDGCYYSKPLLSTGFAKNKSASALALKSAQQMAESLDLTVQNHTTVTAIDAQAQTISTEDDSIHYKALVLTLGAAPINIPLPQALNGRCMPINDLQDYDHFRQQLADHRRVAIIGSGLVGTEYANDLAIAGKDVTVFSLDDAPLQLLLPKTMGQVVQQQLSQQNVDWHMNSTIKDAGVNDDNSLQIELTDGHRFDCDIVLSAVGLKPRTGLAQQAGLTVDTGIVVDKMLQTSGKNIYALGDCAQIERVNLMYVSILTLSAKALAQTLNGNPTKLAMPASPVIVKTPSCPVVANPPPKGTQGQWQIEGETPDLSGCFYNREGQLCGFALTGKKVMQRMKLAKQLPAIL